MNQPLSHTPVQLVIFGLTGDLARKKLLPALYQLVAAGHLPAQSRLIGISRRAVQPAELIAPLRAEAHYDTAILDQLEALLSMAQLDLANLADYQQLATTLQAHDTAIGQCSQRLFYLSMPPQTFAPVIDLLGQAGLQRSCEHDHGLSRLLIEKPFGYDLTSATELVGQLSTHFEESQIYRIDHFIAKETAQNILAFRFGNPIFQTVWDRHHIRRITVTAAESIGIEGRATFYDTTGALRDVIQNHLLQLLTLVAMEEPGAPGATPNATAVHAAKLAVLEAIAPITPDQVATHAVRAQYDTYRAEADLPHSTTETAAALQLSIDNDRWRGVPIILQTGKALSRKATEITLAFRDPRTGQPTPNDLTIHLQPNEGIGLRIVTKAPGLHADVATADMDFRYHRSFTDRQPDAYERVFADAIRGDRTLFVTSAEVLASWRIVEPVLHAWSRSADDLTTYPAGSDISRLGDQLPG